jgi:uncharacterized protein (DUF427 family)
VPFEYDGRERPPFAIAPGEGQESVWDYPRPPRLAGETREVVVRAGGLELARSSRALRILETASAPAVYLPPADVRMELLAHAAGRSLCEWKGAASYRDVVVPGGRRIPRAAWSYPEPSPAFATIRDYISFYPALVECSLGGVRVTPQPGGFYGGWLTPEIVGPIKGAPGTEWW